MVTTVGVPAETVSSVLLTSPSADLHPSVSASIAEDSSVKKEASGSTRLHLATTQRTAVCTQWAAHSHYSLWLGVTRTMAHSIRSATGVYDAFGEVSADERLPILSEELNVQF